MNNKYIDTYIENYVKPFRSFITSEYTLNIGGLADFITVDDYEVSLLLHKLQMYGFEVTISKGQDTIDEILVEYTNKENSKHELFEYRIENLISIINLSSKTGISIVGILVMQIVSKLICKLKTIYKVIILDLDDTVWKGTLVEDGIAIIKQGLHSNDASPFISFMRFIRTMAIELGLYVAICSRNNIKEVLSAIDQLNDKEFPLKGQIDCIVANYIDKSKNIKSIARQLSILPNACVFIDDNQLVRDEVKQNLPEVFVPDWKNHDELLTLLITCCIFDRFELSLKSRNRKRQYEILQQEREKSYLPQLFVKVSGDINHTEANRLYTKSNQFRFAEKKDANANSKSCIFEIYRDNGEKLGICSAITYMESDQEIHILNWAISCRYFEIGLEEYILMYIFSLSDGRPISFTFNETDFNGKAVALIEKYKSGFVKKGRTLNFTPNVQLINDIQHNTNLNEYRNE
ncbi:MAG: HAD-IIIC family phosphatase [Roseburia sp.]|nr:HAD-IIIC family phosphatase [Roseburia sp.]MCM1420066.1 HAD-IIIC family phosphatase [Bacteroides sp.]